MIAVHRGQALQQAARAKAEVNLGTRDRRSLPLKESAITTWRAILALIQVRGRAGLAPDDDGLYRFRFCNHEIAAKAGCSARTVIRHRTALQQAGIIANQTWRGAQHPFELAISGRYLGLVEPLQGDAASDRLSALLDNALGSGDMLSPLPETPEERKENVSVDKCATGTRPDSGDGFDSEPGPQADHGLEERKHGKQAADGGDGHSGASGRTGGRPADPTLTPIAEANAGLLWAFARACLWRGAPITPRQEAIARRHILSLYAQVTEKEMESWHVRFIGMVRAAADYIERKPDRYIVSPDHWFKPGNLKGFRGAWPWYLRRELAQKKAGNEAELNRCWQLWQRNERAYPSRRRDRLELWRALTDRVAQLGDQQLLALWMTRFTASPLDA